MRAPLKLAMNSRGQAAIFVALMFNVLFVFFAMAINVALVVHDKINLQNSADLAAYYAASKQAELLNVIAHENYMIRQSYKLLAWRYRMLGTMGFVLNGPNSNGGSTPTHPAMTTNVDEKVYEPLSGTGNPPRYPSVCVIYAPTWPPPDVPANENLCNQEGLSIPALPVVQEIFATGFNHGISELSKQLKAKFDVQCQHSGAADWWFAMSILHAFRLDQRNRKMIIQKIARSMSSASKGNGDFTDLDGNSVREGALQTFKKNLTYANRVAFDESQFQIMNSLESIDPGLWIPEVQILPTVLYTDKDTTGQRCDSKIQTLNNLPMDPGARANLKAGMPVGFDASDLENFKDAAVEPFANDDDGYQFTIGFEKNPWYMPYVGINVTTTPRQIFFPIGGGISMVARAFAKPFGGRIGPWYMSRWNQGDNMSTGELTDALMAPRYASGTSMDPKDPRRFPNYSRWPGDKNGLTTYLALNSIQGMNTVHPTFDNYKNIKSDITSSNDDDILAWDFQLGTAPPIRNLEIAAISPDLFDITYYSIEPNFYNNYGQKLAASAAAFQIDTNNYPIRADLGYSKADPKLIGFTVQDQLKASLSVFKQEAFYFIRDRAHILTSWLAGPGAFNYDVQESLFSFNFGKCSLPDDALKYRTPGSCAAGGGRTGYSVKLISRDALGSSKHLIGGDGGAAGAIKNPPPSGKGW